MQELDQCPLRLQRLKLRMAQYSYQVRYVPGKEQTVADALSRYPVEKKDESITDAIDAYVKMLTIAGLPVSDARFVELRDATQEDPELSLLLQYLQTTWPHNRGMVRQEVRSYWYSRHNLSSLDGLVLRGNQIFIPKQLRKEMLQRAHEGHLGLAKTSKRIYVVATHECRGTRDGTSV